MGYYIGVDIGTTGIRAGVYNEEFNIVGEGVGKSILIRGAGGEIYQKPDDILAETIKAIKESIENARVRSSIKREEIEVISFDGQMAGIMGIDENWNAVTPYDSWLDTRCYKQVNYILEIARDKVIEKCGIVPSINHAPKILWWRDEHPEIYKKIAKFIQPAGWVAGKLCNLKSEDAFIDWTYIHFSGFSNISALKWDNELLEIFDVPISKLPKIVPPFTLVGFIDEKMAGNLGIPSGVPVAAGCGDTASSFLGSGAVKPGIGIDVGGTASVFSLTTRNKIVDNTALVYSSRAVVEGLWHIMSYINGGGQNLEWFRENFGREKDFSDLNKEAESIPPGSEGLIFIPHLEGRAYPPNPHKRGTWTGFTRNHNLYHFYRSILESVGYEYLLYKKRIDELAKKSVLNEIRAVGGAAKSDLWNQIKSDILGIEYKTINRKDSTLLGQALIGAKAIGYISNIPVVVDNIIKTKKSYRPRLEHSEYYIRNFSKYVEAFNLSSLNAEPHEIA